MLIKSRFQKVFLVLHPLYYYNKIYLKQREEILNLINNEDKSSFQKFQKIEKPSNISSQIIQTDLEQIKQMIKNENINAQNFKEQIQNFCQMIEQSSWSYMIASSQLNEILVLFHYSKLKQFLNSDQPEYRQTISVLDKICLKQISLFQDQYDHLNNQSLKQLSSLIYSANQIGLQSSLNKAWDLFSTKNFKEMVRNNLDFDTSLDLLFFASTIQDKSTNVIKIQENICSQVVNYCQSLKSINQIERYSHLFSLIQKFLSEEQDLQQNQHSILHKKLVQLFNQEEIQQLSSKFKDLKELVIILTSLIKKHTKLKLLYDDEIQEFIKKILLILKIESISNISGVQLMNLTINIKLLHQIDNLKDTDSIKMISMILLEKIRNLLFIQQIDPKYAISIIYEFFFRIKSYNHYSLHQMEKILFDLNIQNLSNFDVLQFAYCLRKFQKPNEIYINKLDEVYEELLKRKEKNNFDPILQERLNKLIINQENFYHVSLQRKNSQVCYQHLQRLSEIKEKLK